MSYSDYIKDLLYCDLKNILETENYSVSDILEVLTDVVKDIETENKE